MSAYADGSTQYVPLWRAGNNSFCIAPDDGALWSEESGFTYKVSTAGYTDITFSARAYTTTQGPKSVTLQYSTDGVNYYNVQSNVSLNAGSTLEQVFLNTDLPKACENQRVIYIRLVTTEDSTFGGEKLFNNASKGNLYVNDVIISGNDNGDIKMPYTDKATNYFSGTGTIKYVSPSGAPMSYVVTNMGGNVVLSGDYPEEGILLSSAEGFDDTKQEPYYVVIQAQDGTNTSIANGGEFYYKGETVTKFNYNDTSKIFTDYVAEDSLTVSNTSGANTGTLSMYPNGLDATTLSYTGTYGVKASWSDTNKFNATKNLDNPKNNGFWLIETSTKNFKDLTLSLDQLSSNKGPRDWGIAYSTNGSDFTYVENSNSRAISNDASSTPVSTYSNFVLPNECDNLDKLYIKVFINGGESVDTTELELVTKGNTGINGIELCGIPTTTYVDINTVLLADTNGTLSDASVSCVNVYENDKLLGTTDDNGIINIKARDDGNTKITLNGEGIAERTNISVDTSSENKIGLMAYDINNDDYVNAKDFAIINKNTKYIGYKDYFANFINIQTSNYAY